MSLFKARVKHTNTRWLTLSVLASFFAAGIPFWLIPYGKVNLPNALRQPGLFVAGMSALLLCLYSVASFWRSTFTITASVGAAVMARVLVGVVQDPTSHNLWPLEVVIALIVGFICTVPGAIVGSLIARWFSKH